MCYALTLLSYDQVPCRTKQANFETHPRYDMSINTILFTVDIWGNVLFWQIANGIHSCKDKIFQIRLKSNILFNSAWPDCEQSMNLSSLVQDLVHAYHRPSLFRQVNSLFTRPERRWSHRVTFWSWNSLFCQYHCISFPGHLLQLIVDSSFVRRIQIEIL